MAMAEEEVEKMKMAEVVVKMVEVAVVDMVMEVLFDMVVVVIAANMVVVNVMVEVGAVKTMVTVVGEEDQGRDQTNGNRNIQAGKIGIHANQHNLQDTKVYTILDRTVHSLPPRILD